MPTAMIPRQCLIGSDTPISQFSYKAMYADLPTVLFVLLPVFVILILVLQSIVRTHITAHILIVRTGGVNHNAFDSNSPASLVAGVVCEYQFP